MMRILRYLLLLALIYFCENLQAQSCFNVSAGNDTTISCAQVCLDLKARIPDVRTTDDYQVVSIPYTPFPYINPVGGVEFNPVYIDDKWSSVINLPFTFCYYGQNYTRCIVGTNGVLSFDISPAGGFNNFVLPSGVTIPSTVYPPATIMGPFHDIDPENGLQPYDRRMEYIVTGTAPCRKFVLNFYRIPYFGCPTDTFNVSTQQMVLYEGSGIIDIFIQTKPIACGSSTNSGRAILGIQNLSRDKAAWVPGRNNTGWSAQREGWRFVPSGTTSLLNRVELYKNGSLVSTGTTTSLGNGELEALFPNICQPESSMSYVVRAFYKQCDNGVNETEGSDTIVVFKGFAPIVTDVDDVSCYGGTNGKITIISPLASDIEYSIDGINWQASPVFIVPANSYTVQARVIGLPCSGSVNVVVNEPALLTASAAALMASCANNDGSLVITAAGGTTAYAYSIDNGLNYQASNQFLNLAFGNYNNIIVKDANGCIAPATSSVLLNDTMRLELGSDQTICFGSTVTLITQTNPQTNIFKWIPATGLSSDIVKEPVASPADTTRYILNAQWGVCQRQDTVTVNVLHKPVVDAGKDTAVCYKTNAFLNGIATNLSGTVNYSWSPADSLSTPNAASTIARMDTTRQFKLTVTDNYGCNFSVSDSVKVTMMPLLVVFAGNDTNAILGKPHQLLASGGLNYVWSPAAPLNDPFIPNPLAILHKDTYFTVLVTDAIGCTDDDDVFVKAYEGPQYYVPNAFSPNGDGLNDVFRPIPVGIKSTQYFRVFNRWGELMFETKEWLKGWDGNFKGKKATAGTYTWMIRGTDKNGKTVEMQGTVILLQ
jgi:gliding motility-associated-like protein